MAAAHNRRHAQTPPRPSLRRLFLTGLLTLLPIWLTWVVVKFVFVLLSDISRPLIGPLLASARGDAIRRRSAGSTSPGCRPRSRWSPRSP